MDSDYHRPSGHHRDPPHGQPNRASAPPWWVPDSPAMPMPPAPEDATIVIQRISAEALPPDATMVIPRVGWHRGPAGARTDPPPGPGGPPNPDAAHGPTRPGSGRAAPAGTRALPRRGGQRPTPETGMSDAVVGMRTAKTAGVVRAGALMAVATVVSRITGLLAKVVIAAAIGGGIVNGSYTVANTLPNIVFEMLIGGVLTSVAIPLLIRAQRSDADGGEAYIQRLMSLAVVALLGATAVAVACAPLLTRLYLSSNDHTTDHALATQLAFLLLPQIFFYGMAALFGAILNTKERFGAPAWAPVLNNIVVIGVAVMLITMRGALLTPDEITPAQILVLGIGTTVGIVAQAIVLVPSLRRAGFRWKWRWGWDPRLSEAGALMLWAVLYALTSQVSYVVTTRIASGTSGGGPWTFSMASLLFQMPYGVLGVAVLTAIMPRMSQHAAARQMERVKDDMSLAIRLSAAALLPVTAGLLVLASALGVLLLRYRAVALDAALQVGTTLTAMAIGLLPLAITLVQMRVFYAVKDARTPTIINAIMVAVRLPLLFAALTLQPHYVIPGLAAATAISYIVGAIVGEIWLRARFGPMGSRRTLITIGKMSAASAAGGIAALLVVDRTVGLIPGNPANALGTLVLGGVVGLVVIAAAAVALRVEEIEPLRRKLLPRRSGRGPAAARAGAAGPGTARRATDVNSATEADRRAARPAAHRVPQPRERGTLSSSGAPRPAPDETRRIQRVPDDSTTLTNGPLHPGAVLAPAGLAPGSTVGSRYRLVSLITTDSAGNQFWRAQDTVLPRDMAITVLPESTSTPATVARTLRVGRLHHIGLPQTLDVGEGKGWSYVVGQWVDGATLADLVAGGPLEPEVATSITAKLSEAVAEAHRNGIALGGVNPYLVRVNFDGQVRLSHLIAHGAANPEQDIRGVGALLYLMLTGTWPLPTAGLPFTLAATDGGRELPADAVQRGIPEALSALAGKALHPEEPNGIHAVGAIATLLRRPDTDMSGAPAAPSRAEPRALTPAERRLVKERRAKLATALIMLVIFAALLTIVVASVSKHFMSTIAPSSDYNVQRLDTYTTAPPTPGQSTAPATAAHQQTAQAPAPATNTATAPAAAVKIAGASVYDPEGTPPHDYASYVDRAFDGDPRTSWLTWMYKRQFPSLKTGVGLTLQFDKAITPTSVTITSNTTPTTFQIRAATGPTMPLSQATVVGTGTVAKDQSSVTIPVSGAPSSQYLIVFVTALAPAGSQFQSNIAEIAVSGH